MLHKYLKKPIQGSRSFSTLYTSVNPVDNKQFSESAMTTDAELEVKLQKAHDLYNKDKRRHDRFVVMEERFAKLKNVHKILHERQAEFAKLMTLELGKPLAQAEGEVMKCASHIEYTIKNSIEHAQDEVIHTELHKSFVTHDPIGPFLGITPWNFPFWMPFKQCIQPLVLGNPVLLKGPPSTPLCSAAIEKMFEDAGFVDGEYQNLFITNEQAEKVISDRRVRGVKFTGSTTGGKIVASIAGQHMKPGCYELGGSCPFVVFDDSDIELAVEKAYISRMNNNAQACINAKRIIVMDNIYDKFRDALVEKIKSTVKLGDPMDKENVTVGPLALARLTDQLRD